MAILSFTFFFLIFKLLFTTNVYASPKSSTLRTTLSPLLSDNNNNIQKQESSSIIPTTTSTSTSNNCNFSDDTPSSCRLPINPKLLLPGTTLHCVKSDNSTMMPFAILICGPNTHCLNGIVTNGRALVAIHGGPGQSSGVLNGLAPISETLPVILYDQRHSGRSSTLTTPVGDDIESTMLNYVQELTIVLDQFHVDKADLLGHSFGASIAIDYARNHPERILSLILLSPVIDGTWWQNDANKHRLYVTEDKSDPIPEIGDTSASQELMLRWVLGPTYQNIQVLAEEFICNAADDVYSIVWGQNEDVVNGQVKDYHRKDILIDLMQDKGIRVMLGCGMYDEAPPKRMLDLAHELNALNNNNNNNKQDTSDTTDTTTSSTTSSTTTTSVVIIPYSAHVPAQKDWKYYVESIKSFLSNQEIKPITSSHPLPNVEATIAHFQSELRHLESAESVDDRSYPYLGRLLAVKQLPPNGLIQLNPTKMNELVLTLSDHSAHIDWDIVQAVVDVWYIASIIDPSKINDPLLRPPEQLFNALCTRLEGYKISTSPVDRIMYYVVGFGLQRLHVPCAPKFVAYNWKEIATSNGMNMKQEYPAIYIYLLTHVYIYNTDFGSIKMSNVNEQVKEEIVEAVDELIEMVPFGLEPRGFYRIYNGMVAPPNNNDKGSVSKHSPSINLNAMFDCVCEMFFTVTRVHGRDHALANALAIRVYEWMSERTNEKNEGENRGHLLAVCLAAWQVWEDSPIYI